MDGLHGCVVGAQLQAAALTSAHSQTLGALMAARLTSLHAENEPDIKNEGERNVCMQEFTATLLDPCISEPEFQVRPMALSYWQAVWSRLAAAFHA